MKADGLLPTCTTLCSLKHLNNLIEQDHPNIKSRINVMLSFIWFGKAAIVMAGIELMHHIREERFELRVSIKEAAVPAIWNAVLPA